MIGRTLPPSLARLLALLALLWPVLVSPSAGSAQTMLTNGSPLFVRLPIIPDTQGRPERLVSFTDSYGIFVPPGARKLVVRFESEPSADVELLVDFGVPPGTRGIGNKVALFRQRVNPLGFAEIEISALTHPELTPGTYFIGFFVEKVLTQFTGTLTASVDGGAVDSLFPLEKSEFSTDLDGWTRNDTASPIPGTTVGTSFALLQHEAEGGNPGGYARLRAGSGGEDWFVAPEKFHVDLLALDEPRFDFDIRRFSGGSQAQFAVEVRVYSANGGYRWRSQITPNIADGWVSVSAPIREDLWIRFAGEDYYTTVFSDVVRIEVRATYTSTTGQVGLDNFRIVTRGTAPAKDVLPLITSFSGGIDRWERNEADPDLLPGATEGDASTLLVWIEEEGNPGGFIRVADNGGPALDAFVAPFDYRGNYSNLSGPRFEFDYRHLSAGGATRPVGIRIVGEDGTAYEWTGATPGDIWGRQVAPLEAAVWVLASGEASFESVIANIVRIEISADQADGPDWNQLDNFAVRTDDSPPLISTLVTNPSSVLFTGVATGPNPAAAEIQVTSSGDTLAWNGAVEGELADRVMLSATSGQTPSKITIALDTLDLAAGSYTVMVTLTPVGTTTAPAVIEVVIELGGQPVPTPLISAGGVVNAGSNLDLLAPGALGTIYGVNLGGPVEGWLTSFQGRSNDRLPVNVSGVRVLVLSVSGVLIAEAPIVYASDKQINFQMPFEVAGLTVVRIVVENQRARSIPEPVDIAPAAPGLFTMAGNRAIVLNPDGTLNGASSAAPRNKVFAMFLTGQGGTAPQWPTGRAASAYPLIYAPGITRVFIGGVEAKIHFLGLAPGLVGVTQLNIEPAWETPLGDQPIVVVIEGFESNTAVITIR